MKGRLESAGIHQEKNARAMHFQGNVSDTADRRGHEAAAFVENLGAHLEAAHWGPVDCVNPLDEIREHMEIE